MNTFKLAYRFELPNGRERVFTLHLQSDTAELTPGSTQNAPPWTKLDFHQCKGCPLSANEASHCPAALHMSELIDRASDLFVESATLVHDNERRWRVFGDRVSELASAYDSG